MSLVQLVTMYVFLVLMLALPIKILMRLLFNIDAVLLGDAMVQHMTPGACMTITEVAGA